MSKGEKVRESVVFPQRRVTFTFTHDTLGDERVGSRFEDAFAQYNEASRATSYGRDAAGRPVFDWQDFTASNGVRITAHAVDVVMPKDWCDTMERPKAQCGCPDCGSSLIDLGPGLRNTPPAVDIEAMQLEYYKRGFNEGREFGKMEVPLIMCSETIRAAVLRGDRWATGLASGLGSLAREHMKAMTTVNAEPIPISAPAVDAGARMFGHAARQAALEEAAGIADSCMTYQTTTAQCIAQAIREKKEGA